MQVQFLSDDEILIVSKPLAKAIGIGESIILRRLHFWLEYNRMDSGKAPTHFRNGHWWSYNTYDQWVEDIGIYSKRTIERYFLTLEGLGLVKSTDEYNSFAIDKTKWYTIDYEVYEAFLEMWAEAGQPITNGGTKSEEYLAFVDRWNKNYAYISEVRINPPTRQSDVMDTPVCHDDDDNLAASDTANLTRPLPVSPENPSITTPAAADADGRRESELDQFQQEQMDANRSSIKSSEKNTGTLNSKNEMFVHPMVAEINKASEKPITENQVKRLFERVKTTDEAGGRHSFPSRAEMYDTVPGFKEFFSIRVLFHKNIIGKGEIRNIGNLISDLQREDRPDNGWLDWKLKNKAITMRTVAGEPEETSTDLTEEEARAMGFIV